MPVNSAFSIPRFRNHASHSRLRRTTWWGLLVIKIPIFKEVTKMVEGVKRLRIQLSMSLLIGLLPMGIGTPLWAYSPQSASEAPARSRHEPGDSKQ